MTRFAPFSDVELYLIRRGLKLIPPYGPALEYRQKQRTAVTRIEDMCAQIDDVLATRQREDQEA